MLRRISTALRRTLSREGTPSNSYNSNYDFTDPEPARPTLEQQISQPESIPELQISPPESVPEHDVSPGPVGISPKKKDRRISAVGRGMKVKSKKVLERVVRGIIRHDTYRLYCYRL